MPPHTSVKWLGATKALRLTARSAHPSMPHKCHCLFGLSCTHTHMWAHTLRHYHCHCDVAPRSWVECVGLADRSAFDLTAHSKMSKQDMTAYEKFAEPKVVDMVKVRAAARRRDGDLVLEAAVCLAEAAQNRYCVSLPVHIGTRCMHSRHTPRAHRMWHRMYTHGSGADDRKYSSSTDLNRAAHKA
jgi:hypothetical protein